MIKFLPNSIQETECFLCREANITTKDGTEHRVEYQIIIKMADRDSTVPVITEIQVEGIPDLDDYTYDYCLNISEEEMERRINVREDIYEQVKQALYSFYKVKVTL